MNTEEAGIENDPMSVRKLSMFKPKSDLPLTEEELNTLKNKQKLS